MDMDNKLKNEQDLERYGVWVKTGSEPISDLNESNFDYDNLDDSEVFEDSVADIDMEAMEDFAPPEFTSSSETINEDEIQDEISDLDLDLDLDLDILSEPEVAEISAENPNGMADVEEFEDFNAPLPDMTAPDSLDEDESTVTIRKIEKELEHLHMEIVQLKNTLNSKTMTEKNEHAGGFFNESEDDESIALTNDELDIILDSESLEENSAYVSDESLDNPSFADPIEEDIIISDWVDDETPIGEEAEIEDEDDIINLNFDEDSSTVSTDSDFISNNEDPIDDDTSDNTVFEDVGAIELDSIMELTSTEEDEHDDIELESWEDEEISIELNLQDSDLQESEDAQIEDQISFSDTVDMDILKESKDIDLPLIENEEDSDMDSYPPPVTTDSLQGDMRKVLQYIDKLLEFLPNSKYKEFARSDYFTMYSRLLKDLDIAK